MRTVSGLALTVALALAAAGALAGCGERRPAAPPEEPPAPIAHPTGTTFDIPAPLPDVPPVRVEVLHAGQGKQVRRMSDVTVHYVASVAGGAEYQSTRSAGAPKPVRAGVGAVLPGIDLALVQMRQGDHWRVTVPAPLAFGTHGGPKVPPNSTVVWEIEVVSVK
jgi:FK506-binding protein 1